MKPVPFVYVIIFIACILVFVAVAAWLFLQDKGANRKRIGKNARNAFAWFIRGKWIGKKTRNFFAQHWAIPIAGMVFVVLNLLWICISCVVNSFFGESKSIAEIQVYIGGICGAILLVGNLYANNRRNNLTEKGQLDIRFKDAATLLAADNTSAILSGIYAMHQIAVEASRSGGSDGYVKIIKEILCAFIRENSGDGHSEEYGDILVRKKSDVVFQTIVDVLFKKDEGIYHDYPTDLKYSALNGLNFYNAKLTGANLQGTILSGADLSGANLWEANLSEADLSAANLSEADLSGVFLLGANLSKANLQYANLQHANLSGVNLLEANLSEANLHGVSLSEANLMSADLTGVNLKRANLWETNLWGTYLLDVNLSDANLYGADLSRSDLWGVKLQNAFLWGADFSNALNLDLADFSNARINPKTNFTGTYYEGVPIEDITKPRA